MQQDTLRSYGSVSRFNHFLTAAIVIVMIAIGLYFGSLPRGDTKLFWMKLHFSIGAVALPFLVFRIVWRIKHKFIEEFPQPAPLQKLAKAVHVLLLVGITVQIITGPLAVWTGGHALEIFGLFAIPSWTGKHEGLHEIFETIHVISAFIIIALLILHITGAIKHLLFDRERYLGRMIGRRRD